MTEPIVIDLPLPPKVLHPNARPHWRAKAAATKRARWDARLVASTVRPDEPMVRATYELEFKLPVHRDYDGLLSWCKAYFDGLVDGGVLKDDNHFRPLGITQTSGKKATGGQYGVRILVYADDQDK